MSKAIYIRTSTLEQEPENQIRDCKSLFEGDYELYQDKQSAWKDSKDRNDFERLKKDIKLSKVNDLYVWDLDRLFRDRRKLIEFFTLCKLFKTKIYSFRQQWLEQLNKIPEPFNEIMHSLMLQIMGWIAEEESTKKSERVKLAIRKESGITKSYKGNKWGRQYLNLGKEINELYKNGVSMNKITKQVFYTNKSGNRKYVSLGYVHKVIHGETNE